MMSLIFIVAVLSLLLLPLTCLSIFYSLQFQQQQQNTSTSSNSILRSYLAHSNLSSLWKLLIFPNSTTQSKISSSATSAAAGVRRHEGGREAAECSVCLCGIQQGEETMELTCGHLFHKPCLDAWIGTGRATCPLCRGRVSFPAVVHDGAELLLFRFCSSFSSANSRRGQAQGHDTWWLR